MTAKPIADTFFGVATVAAELEPSEVSIRNALRREWETQARFRNGLAHAEWAVGWEDAETGEPVPPGSTRIKNVDGVPTLINLSIDTNVIIDNNQPPDPARSQDPAFRVGLSRASAR